MTKLFGGGPPKPKIPAQVVVEDVQKIEGDKEEEVKRQKRKSFLTEGRESTQLVGITSQLKKRLGE